MKTIFLSLLFSLSLFSAELNSLLSGYKKSSDLSKLTKKDSSGFLEIYTREDLERMQVLNLLDILKTIPGIYLNRGSNNLTLFTTNSVKSAPLTYTRLYINDHDMTSSSFGSGFLIWGEMPIEYIDHIEVYKATSSMEFGNENAAVIIRLYTKDAHRDSGSKVRLSADHREGSDLNIYTADITKSGLSYFAYANHNYIERKSYYNSYKEKRYRLNSDKQGHNLYANLTYDNYVLELGSYYKKSGSFIGIGDHKTPEGGGLDANQNYMHLTKKFATQLKLQISYDRLSYDRDYIDKNGIHIANRPPITDYHLQFNDDIFSIIAEKKLHYKNSQLFCGAFYKYKGFDSQGAYFDENNSTNSYSNNSANGLHLYSLYAEEHYTINDNFYLIASLKGDFFRYTKSVKSQNELLSKIGFVAKNESFEYKLFFQKSYVPLALYQIYNPDNTPYRANPNLDTQDISLITSGLRYKNVTDEIALEMVYAESNTIAMYDRSTSYGWKNSNVKVWKTLSQLSYTHRFNINNKIICNLNYGSNNQHINFSPETEASLRSFNRYNKLDFYNELIYRSAYELYGISMRSSVDFTSAIKYHYSRDLSLGIRADNILNRAYEVPYRGLNRSIAVTDQKFLLNCEYLF